MSIILDPNAKEPAPVAKEWSRPTEVPCSCGGTARQIEGTQYGCARCGQTRVVWTGFDDPAWF